MATNGFTDKSQYTCGIPCNISPGFKWDVPQIISTNPNPKFKYAVLVLNRPMTQRQDFISQIWNNATIRMCVDGGTKRWDAFSNDLPEDMQKSLKLPELVTGDFDSITDEVKQKYEMKGCKVIHTPDQDHTDFTKALKELHKFCQENDIEIQHAIALGQVSQRVDQFLANIQTLFLVKEKRLFPNLKVYLISDDAISWLLDPGHHAISIPQESLEHRRAWCSLAPIGEPCESATTTGLKWNLDDRTLRFGDLVSTSNTFDGCPIVTVDCSNILLWSMRIPSIMLNAGVSYNALICCVDATQRTAPHQWDLPPSSACVYGSTRRNNYLYNFFKK